MKKPVRVLGLDSVIAIAAGGVHFLALKSDGTVWGWGYTLFGRLPGEKQDEMVYFPRQVPVLNAFDANGVLDIVSSCHRVIVSSCPADADHKRDDTKGGMMLCMNRMLGILVFAIGIGTSVARTAGDSPAPADAEMFRRSLVSAGDSARIQHTLAKARDGGEITVAVIGGSITAGAKASTPARNYGSLVAQWWRQNFPRAQVKFVNAGIGATGSNFGALRAQRDLLSKKPDFVVVEYAVNDGNTQAAAESLEGLTRQILNQPNQPAVVLLFTMNQKGGNAQEWHARIGSHYGLPMVSFRDALWPEIQAGRIKWADVEADEVHPNDRGHAYCAAFVTSVLDKVLRELPPQDKLPEIKPLPQPLISDLFAHAALFEADALKPAANTGWAYDPGLKAWKSDKPGSVIEFEIEGRVIFTMHFVIKGPMGKARVSVDGKPVKELNAWFDQTWGGYRQTNEILRLPEAGRHRVRFELLEDKSEGSTGNEFRILGLGAAGMGNP